MAQNIWTQGDFVVANMTPNTGDVICESIATGLTATGSTAAGALQLTSQINIVGTTASGTGVRLPVNDAPGAIVVVKNKGGSVLLPYPPSGGILNGGTVDQAGGTIAATTGVARFVNLGSLGYEII